MAPLSKKGPGHFFPLAALGLWLVVAAAARAVAQEPVDHAAWDALVRRHVGAAGFVDYAGFAGDQESLGRYLAILAAADPSSLPREGQLAFWINAYNVCVVKGVLDRYPIKSVRPIRGFFDQARYQVAGQWLTIDEIAGQGKRLGDWRIHMAIVCASQGCPPLLNEAYAPDRLEEQLANQARRYLADPLRGLRLEGKRLWVSKIFKWGQKDVVPGGRLTTETLLNAIAPYLDPTQVSALRQQRPTLKFMEYDWTLNDRQRRG